MSDRVKDFGSEIEDDVDEELEAPLFTLYGEEFSAHPAVQGSVLLNFIADADSGEGGRAAASLIQFLKSAMPEDEFKRLNALFNDPVRTVSMAKIAEIVGWLVEVYTGGRPTRAQRRSSVGRSARGRTSKLDQSLEE